MGGYGSFFNGKFVAGYKYIVFNGKLVGKYTNPMPSVWGPGMLVSVMWFGKWKVVEERIMGIKNGKTSTFQFGCQLDPKGW